MELGNILAITACFPGLGNVGGESLGSFQVFLAHYRILQLQ